MWKLLFLLLSGCTNRFYIANHVIVSSRQILTWSRTFFRNNSTHYIKNEYSNCVNIQRPVEIINNCIIKFAIDNYNIGSTENYFDVCKFKFDVCVAGSEMQFQKQFSNMFRSSESRAWDWVLWSLWKFLEGNFNIWN